MSWLWIAGLLATADVLFMNLRSSPLLARPVQLRSSVASGSSDTLDILALGVRRGLGLRDVVALGARHSISSGSALAEIVALLDRGVEAQDAVRQSAIAPQTSLGIVLVALASAVSSGVRLDAELDRVRADVQLLDTNATAAAARRMSVWQSGPLVLCHLPAFVLVGVAPTVLPLLRGVTV